LAPPLVIRGTLLFPPKTPCVDQKWAQIKTIRKLWPAPNLRPKCDAEIKGNLPRFLKSLDKKHGNLTLKVEGKKSEGNQPKMGTGPSTGDYPPKFRE